MESAMKQFGVFTLLVLCLPQLASAQEPTFVEGHVFSKFSGVPLRNALVDMPRYLASNPFYREVAVRFHGATDCV